MIALDELKQLVMQSGPLRIQVNGRSMEPLLADGRDSVVIVKKTSPPKKGDIVFFVDSLGRTIMHRVYRFDENGYYFLGDALRRAEGPVPEEQIFAVVTHIVRNGRSISMKSPSMRLYGFVRAHTGNVIPYAVAYFRNKK